MPELVIPPGFGVPRNDVEWVANVADWALERRGEYPTPVCSQCGQELAGMYWQRPDDDGSRQRAPWCERCASRVGEYSPVTAEQIMAGSSPGGGA